MTPDPSVADVFAGVARRLAAAEAVKPQTPYRRRKARRQQALAWFATIAGPDGLALMAEALALLPEHDRRPGRGRRRRPRIGFKRGMT